MVRMTPPRHVLDTFGVAGALNELSGGQGGAWQVGQLVL